MANKTITVAAVAGLLLLGAAASYFGQRLFAPTLGVAGQAAVDGKGASAAAPAAAAPAGKGPGGAGGPGGGPVPVETVVARGAPIADELSAVGALRSNEGVVLRPEAAGRIATIAFRDGQTVRKGQLLFALDATLNEAEVAQARAEHDLAMANLKRTQDLARQNFVSASAQETAQSNAQVAKAKLELAQARLSKMRIVAPFDGVVGIRNVSLGDYVKDGTDLVNVEDVRTLKVAFKLPERYVTQLQVGQPVDVVADALPGRRFRGNIVAIDPRIDANGRSLEASARLDNSAGLLRPGMFVRVAVIVRERADAIAVPEEAIVPAGTEFFVFKVVDGKAVRARVRPGVRRDGLVELVQGVAPGDVVVVTGQQRLARDGQTVNAVARAPGGRKAPEASPPAAAPAAPPARS